MEHTSEEMSSIMELASLFPLNCFAQLPHKGLTTVCYVANFQAKLPWKLFLPPVCIASAANGAAKQGERAPLAKPAPLPLPSHINYSARVIYRC